MFTSTIATFVSKDLQQPSLSIVSANLLPIPTIIKQRLHVCSEPGEVGSLQLTVHHNTEVNSNSGLTSSILKHNIFAIKYLLTAFKSEYITLAVPEMVHNELYIFRSKRNSSSENALHANTR